MDRERLQTLEALMQVAHAAAKGRGSLQADDDGCEHFELEAPTEGHPPLHCVRTPDGDFWVDPAALHPLVAPAQPFEHFEHRAQQMGGGRLADCRARGFGQEGEP